MTEFQKVTEWLLSFLLFEWKYGLKSTNPVKFRNYFPNEYVVSEFESWGLYKRWVVQRSKRLHKIVRTEWLLVGAVHKNDLSSISLVVVWKRKKEASIGVFICVVVLTTTSNTILSHRYPTHTLTIFTYKFNTVIRYIRRAIQHIFPKRVYVSPLIACEEKIKTVKVHHIMSNNPVNQLDLVRNQHNPPRHQDVKQNQIRNDVPKTKPLASSEGLA